MFQDISSNVCNSAGVIFLQPLKTFHIGLQIYSDILGSLMFFYALEALTVTVNWMYERAHPHKCTYLQRAQYVVWNASKKLHCAQERALNWVRVCWPLAAFWAIDTPGVAVKGERTCPPAIRRFMFLPSGHGRVCLWWANIQKGARS